MAKEAYYFSHDSNASADPKILNMRLDYGLEGYGMYWMIVELLRDQEQYSLPYEQSTFRALAMHMHSKVDTVHKFIKDCIEIYGLFHDNGEQFYSLSLFKRMDKKLEITITRKKAAFIKWNPEQAETMTEQEIIIEVSKGITQAMHMHNISNAQAIHINAKEINQTKETNKTKEIKETSATNAHASDSKIYLDVINYLNEKLDTKYSSKSKATRKLIDSRMNEENKYCLEDFKKVIDIKAKEWVGTDQAKYLRPETLFSNKFEGYLNQLEGDKQPTNSYNKYQYEEPDNPAAIPGVSPETLEQLRKERGL